MSAQPALLDLDAILQLKSPQLYKRMPRFVLRYLKRKIHQEELNDILTRYADKQGVDFMESVVDYFDLQLQVDGLEEIPSDSRFIFASNHPLGGLDGICLSAIIGKKYKHKIKYIVNDLLFFIQNLQAIFLPVNKHGGQSKQMTSSTKEAFESDNQIITFPAGLCSRQQGGVIEDLNWQKNFIHKAIEYKRDIVPVYFEGRNSKFFYKFAQIRKRLGIKANLEMFFLPNEMFKNKNKTFSIRFGKPISYTFFDKSKNTLQWASYVKDRVYDLAIWNK